MCNAGPYGCFLRCWLGEDGNERGEGGRDFDSSEEWMRDWRMRVGFADEVVVVVLVVMNGKWQQRSGGAKSEGQVGKVGRVGR